MTSSHQAADEQALRRLLWDSEALHAAEVRPDGLIVGANAALERWAGRGLQGSILTDLLARPQRGSFLDRLAAAGEDWTVLTLGFLDDGSEDAEDRVVRLRATADGTVLVVAEAARGEHERLVEEVLALNDDLIGTQRTLARRQRELERLQAEARRREQRLRQLEAITLTGLRSPDLEHALDSLLDLALGLAGGDRATILLRDEALAGDLVVAAAVGLSDEDRRSLRVPVGEGVAGAIAASGEGRLVADLEGVSAVSAYPRAGGSLVAVPLVLEDEVIGVLEVSAAERSRFGSDDLALLDRVGERVALSVGHAQLRDRERRISETLQRSLLPAVLPAVPGVRLAARYLPQVRSVQVGGDFYDAVALPGGALGLSIGDVAGKGLPAASTMGMLRSAMRAYAIEDREPGALLSALERLVATEEDTMATGLYARLDPATGALAFANAGHPPPLLVEADGSAAFLREGLSPPLGVLPADRPQSAGHVLAPGGRLVLCTDGLFERRGVDMFESLDGFGQAVQDGPVEPEALADHVIEALRPADGFGDDVALLVVARD